MTPRPYEIWDWDTANIVYAYATLEEAFADVRKEVTVNGPESAATWFLQYDDRVNGYIVAEGNALVKRAFASAIPVSG
ncbi:MAG: hypothetical protein ACR2M3_11100 [Thermomicrobiales bacterium]